MDKRVSNKIKLICSIIAIFMIVNINIIPQSFAGGNTTPLPAPIATFVKVVITGAQVLAAGYFTIRLTLTGIQYFTATAASDKVEQRNRMYWTLFYGVLAYLGIFLFSYAVGL